MSHPRITVVIPVYNRDTELQGALDSVREQTFQDFECIVVDDASTIPIEPIVKELNDPRFIYIRNPVNGGPYNARTCGYREMEGEYLFHLDSDWEAFPWALAQAVRYLDETPEVDAVAGMHLRNHDSRLFVRVRAKKRIVTPEEYVKMPPVPDCVGAVRKHVIEEWLKKRRDYFALESHQWLTFGLKHSQLYVDEPWTRYYVESSDRVSLRIGERRLDDFLKFKDEHEEYIEKIPCVTLDTILLRGWIHLKRAGRTADAEVYEKYLIARNVDYKSMSRRNPVKGIRSRISKLLKRNRADDTYYI
jgi:glycosyltransferase involved in cell wall biosynthesis